MSRLVDVWLLMQEQRRERVRLAIIGALHSGAKFYFDIARLTGWGPATLYPALRELEQSGVVKCTFVEDELSTRCRYQIALDIGTS